VCRGCHQTRAVGTERSADNLALVPSECPGERAGGRVPQPYPSVFAGRNQLRNVRAEDKRPGVAAMAFANRSLFAGDGVKYQDPISSIQLLHQGNALAVKAHDHRRVPRARRRIELTNDLTALIQKVVPARLTRD